MKEHISACVTADFAKSAVAEHAWLSGHYIEWDNVELLDQEDDLCGKKVNDGIQIRLTNNKKKEKTNMKEAICHQNGLPS